MDPCAYEKLSIEEGGVERLLVSFHIERQWNQRVSPEDEGNSRNPTANTIALSGKLPTYFSLMQLCRTRVTIARTNSAGDLREPSLPVLEGAPDVDVITRSAQKLVINAFIVALGQLVKSKGGDFTLPWSQKKAIAKALSNSSVCCLLLKSCLEKTWTQLRMDTGESAHNNQIMINHKRDFLDPHAESVTLNGIDTWWFDALKDYSKRLDVEEEIRNGVTDVLNWAASKGKHNSFFVARGEFQSSEAGKVTFAELTFDKAEASMFSTFFVVNILLNRSILASYSHYHGNSVQAILAQRLAVGLQSASAKFTPLRLFLCAWGAQEFDTGKKSNDDEITLNVAQSNLLRELGTMLGQTANVAGKTAVHAITSIDDTDAKQIHQFLSANSHYLPLSSPRWRKPDRPGGTASGDCSAAGTFDLEKQRKIITEHVMHTPPVWSSHSDLQAQMTTINKWAIKQQEHELQLATTILEHQETFLWRKVAVSILQARQKFEKLVEAGFHMATVACEVYSMELRHILAMCIHELLIVCPLPGVYSIVLLGSLSTRSAIPTSDVELGLLLKVDSGVSDDVSNKKITQVPFFRALEWILRVASVSVDFKLDTVPGSEHNGPFILKASPTSAFACTESFDVLDTVSWLQASCLFETPSSHLFYDLQEAARSFVYTSSESFALSLISYTTEDFRKQPQPVPDPSVHEVSVIAAIIKVWMRILINCIYAKALLNGTFSPSFRTCLLHLETSNAIGENMRKKLSATLEKLWFARGAARAEKPRFLAILNSTHIWDDISWLQKHIRDCKQGREKDDKAFLGELFKAFSET